MYKLALLLVLFIIGCSKAFATQSVDSPEDTGNATLTTTPNTPISRIDTSKCPTEMVEVEGNYCSSVEETCIEWDDKIVNVNGKVRCMRFAPSKCIAAERQHLHFCMDKFEFQKNKSDPLPTVMVSFNEMKVLASRENKRLCYDYEWEFACQGEEMRPYANGFTREPSKCNIDKPWIPFDAAKLGSSDPKIRDAEVQRLSQRTVVDSNADCKSPFGIYNMVGNVDELLINTHTSISKHHNTLKGGHWAIGARNRCTPRTDIHNEDFSFYEVGARLCKDIK